MELERILAELWRRRLWLLPGLVLAVAAALFVSQHRKSVELAHGTAQMLVDTRDSSVGDLSPDLTPMVTRANVYSRLLASPELVGLIGQAAHIPADQIFAQGPVEENAPRAIQEPSAQRRAGQLAGESGRYRLTFDSRVELPIVMVDATAPTADEATRLAQGTVAALQTYVRRLQARANVPARRRVEIRQLGRTSGKIVNDGAATQLAVLAGVAVTFAWGVLILVGSALVRARRRFGDPEPIEAADGFHIWTIEEDGHAEREPLAENGHADPRPVDGNGHADPRPVEGNGHADPRAFDGNGHSDPWAVEGNGHPDPWAVEENGHAEPWALDPNGHSEPGAGRSETPGARRAPDR
jgi:hypothetical protein